MGSTLTNGIYLPAEGERNCYTGLAANWTALDSLIGGYNAHIGNATIHVTAEDKQAWNNHIADTVKHVTAEDKAKWDTVTGKADASALTAHTGNTTIHVTAADKEAWNGKADASALTAHTGDTTIHVTAADKAKWDTVTGKADASALTAHTGDTTIHVTAEDKAKWDTVTNKANDANVVHKSGDESVVGSKRFGNVQSFTGYPTIRLYSTIDDINVVPSYPQQQDIRFTDKNNVIIAYFIFQHRTDSNEPFRTCWRQQKMDGTQGYYSVNFNNLGKFYPENNNAIALGRSNNKWSDVQTYKINALEPSSLSLPSGNFNDIIDISSYITDFSGTANTYTASANGWVTISVNNCTAIQAYIAGLFGDSRTRQTAGTIKFLMPIRKNQTINLQVYGGTLEHARFIPCQGNV